MHQGQIWRQQDVNALSQLERKDLDLFSTSSLFLWLVCQDGLKTIAST